MNYPFWDVGIGYGVLMAVIAILHVFVSHFAIGGGLYLVIAETSARRNNDLARLEYVQGLTKFFVLITLVFGALSGVGIWFIIGLLNPAATEALIHHFVWGWAIEWTFFAVEICAAIIYYYGWRRMPARQHLIVGWIYFAAAWLSLFVINGILSFMLTPGRWLETGSFWDGFFNPTFWPALVFRTGICVLLAGLYAMFVASRQTRAGVAARLVRGNAVWAIAGLVIIVPSAWWYWSAVPAAITRDALDMMRTPIVALRVGGGFAAAIAVAVLAMAIFKPKRVHPVMAVLILALGLGFFGGFEWMRESIRKPYAIYDYMYANAVELAKADDYENEGYLPQIAFRTGDDGADLFRHACRSCHTLDGYKPLKPALDGTDPAFIQALVQGAYVLPGNMPPFLGTAAEAAATAEHIWSRVDRRSLAEIYGLDGLELGEKVFETRCGVCHVWGGHRDNRESLIGLDADELGDILDNGSDYADEMPDFTGTDAEREALITYLMSLEEGSEGQ